MAPAATAASHAAASCSGVSTAHGPATNVNVPAPTKCSPTRTSVRAPGVVPADERVRSLGGGHGELLLWMGVGRKDSETKRTPALGPGFRLESSCSR